MKVPYKLHGKSFKISLDGNCIDFNMVDYIKGPIMLTSLFEFHAISIIFMFKRLCMEHTWNLQRKKVIEVTFFIILC